MTVLEEPSALHALRDSTAVLTFASRPIPLFADYRPIWRVPLLALMLRICCRGSLSSLTRLHILNWSTRTTSAGREILAVLNGTRNPGDVLVRVEPTLNVVIDLAHGEGLVSFPRGDRIQLTSHGIRLADEVDQYDGLHRERKLLHQIGKGLTETWVDRLIRIGSRGNAW